MPSSPSTLLDKILRGRKRHAAPSHRQPNEQRARATDVRLAFLYQCEDGENSMPLLRVELLGAYWFRRIWQRYLSVFGNATLPGQLHSALGPRVQSGFAGLPEPLRRQLYQAHMRYVTRMLQEADPAPVALAELIAGPALLASEHIREGDWYVIEYLDRSRLQVLRQPSADGEMVYATIGLSSDRDGPSRSGSVVRIVPLAVKDPTLHVLLQALHFPQADRQAGAEARPDAGGAPRIRMGTHHHLTVESDNGEFALTLVRQDKEPTLPARKLAALQELIARSQPHPKLPPLSTAGMHVGGVQPGTVTSPGARPQLPVNPMACTSSGPQPFVGVNMVGAGNNTALYSRDGVVAYVDFGMPLPSNLNTMPAGADPCVCGDPVMILSHWDYDHYAMARKVSGAWRRRWIAPQQVIGSVSARELYVRLLVEAPRGGTLALWPTGACGGGPTHWQMPFGFIERGTGAPVNDDCLAVHVRMRDNPGTAPAAACPTMFAPRHALPSSASPAPGQAVIVDNGMLAAWTDAVVRQCFGDAVVVPLTAQLLRTPQQPPAPGAILHLAAQNPALAGVTRARWIPQTGLALPHRVGAGTYIPVLPDGQVWPGGWAISASDFVRLGGCIVDFPPNAAGIPIHDLMCVSPTPGTMWDPNTRSPGAPAPAGATWLPSTTSQRWKPVWGGGAWVLPLPASRAAALTPLPAGPVAIAPMAGVAPVSSAESYVLLPGDAGYQHLPSLQDRYAASSSGQAVPPIVGMMATHHGSASWIPADPAAASLAAAHIPVAGTAKIVYSYGTRIGGLKAGSHCYASSGNGHPRSAAIAAHLAAGWGAPAIPVAFSFNRLNTAPYDFASKQPFNPLALVAGTAPAVANDLGHYNGNVALGVSGASATAPLSRTCPDCGQVRTYFF